KVDRESNRLLERLRSIDLNTTRWNRNTEHHKLPLSCECPLQRQCKILNHHGYERVRSPVETLCLQNRPFELVLLHRVPAENIVQTHTGSGLHILFYSSERHVQTHWFRHLACTAGYCPTQKHKGNEPLNAHHKRPPNMHGKMMETLSAKSR